MVNNGDDNDDEGEEGLAKRARVAEADSWHFLALGSQIIVLVSVWSLVSLFLSF